MITLSTSNRVYGKDTTKVGLSVWETTTFKDIDSLLDHTLTRGLAIAPGIFSSPKRNTNTWLKSEIIAVDIDDTELDFNAICNLPFIKDHALVVYPSSSYLPDKPKVHILFKLDRFVSVEATYKAIYSYVAENIDIPVDISMNRVSQALFGTVNDYTDTYYINENYISLDVTNIVSYMLENRLDSYSINDIIVDDITEHSNNSTYISARAKEHAKQPVEIQVRVTNDALGYILDNFGRGDYVTEWLPMIISAYAGSHGDKSTLNLILNHNDISWTKKERASFVKWWHTFKLKQGYTVATLFKMARDKGWLQYSPVEIKEYAEIHTDDLSTWIKTYPYTDRLLLISQTGMGKTLASIELLKAKGVPKSVYFAPTIKLCKNLSAVLTSHGIDNLLYIDNEGKTLDSDELTKANVLVTTLQTFANKIAKRGLAGKYKFAVIDEIDTLLSSFVLSGIKLPNAGSHVSTLEAKYGLKGLYEVLQSCETVLALDATATQLSTKAMELFSLGTVRVVKNTYTRPKADVYLTHSLQNTYSKILELAKQGKKLVLVVDKKSMTEKLTIMLGLEGVDNVLTINGDTHNDSKVSEFFTDVDKYAQEYQVVIYNAAMGSGVSITRFKPDVIIQIADYVTQRSHLQMLNRYRQQNLVYVYIPSSESLYRPTVSEVYTDLEKTIRREIGFLSNEDVELDTLSVLAEQLSKYALIDIYSQKLSPKDFYRRLLIEDGRNVIDLTPTDDKAKDIATKASEILKERKEFILTTWRDVEPVERTDYQPDIEPIDYARGLLHNHINTIVPNNSNLPISDLELAELVLEYDSYIYLYEKTLNPQDAINVTIGDILNTNKARYTYRLYVSKLEVIFLLRILFNDKLVDINEYDIIDRVPKFVQEVEFRQHAYNLLVKDYRNYYDRLANKYRGDMIKLAYYLAKNILKAIGIKLSKKTVTIDGSKQKIYKPYSDIGKLAKFRGVTDTLSLIDLEPIILQNKLGMDSFTNLSDRRKKEVLDIVETNNLTLYDAVKEQILL